MKKNNLLPKASEPAALWDGRHQISGTLQLWEECVVFRLTEFKKSHLNLRISFSEIAKVEEFLVYDLARNGLKITNKDGKYDLFVLDDAPKFKRLLEESLTRFLAK